MKYTTDLDKELQELSKNDWDTFLQLFSPECILAAKICMLRNNGKSHNQIANRFHITKAAVRWKNENCQCDKPSEFSHEMNAEFRKANN